MYILLSARIVQKPQLRHSLKHLSAKHPPKALSCHLAAMAGVARSYFTPLLLRPNPSSICHPATSSFFPKATTSLLKSHAKRPSPSFRLFSSASIMSGTNPYFDISWIDPRGNGACPLPALFVSMRVSPPTSVPSNPHRFSVLPADDLPRGGLGSH